MCNKLNFEAIELASFRDFYILVSCICLYILLLLSLIVLYLNHARHLLKGIINIFCRMRATSYL